MSFDPSYGNGKFVRRIAIFTGKRGGFGAMRRLIRNIQNDDGMELKLIASDMHLNEKFGRTVDEMSKSTTVDAVVDLGNYGDSNVDRARALGRCVEGMAGVLDEMRPDFLVALGDRGETLAAAFAAVETGIIMAHIQAGDISGGLDDIHRHSITKLSHLHFSQNERQRQRVIQLGEAAERVWNTGAPYVDNILHAEYPSLSDAKASVGLTRDKPFLIVVQHSDTYRPDHAYADTRAIFDALDQRDEEVLVIHPCSDPGFEGVIKAIDEIEGSDRYVVKKSVEAMTFLSLLSGASALVGNSSGGIIEAPYFRLPFVLVGDRQDGRDMAANVRPTRPNADDILEALNEVDTADFRGSLKADDRPFGDGNACERIYKVLRDTEPSEALFRKRITY